MDVSQTVMKFISYQKYALYIFDIKFIYIIPFKVCISN